MNQISKQNVSSRTLTLSAILALIGMCGILPACSAQGGSDTAKAAEAPKDTGPVAEIDGQPVPMSELEKAAEPQFKQLEQQKAQMLKQLEDSRRKILEGTLNDLVEEKLIAAEAAKRGVSADELIKSEVDAKVTPVTDQEVTDFYTKFSEENKGRRQIPPIEQAAEQIKTYLGQQRADKARTDFISSLRQSHKVKILLEVQRTAVEVGSAPTKGPANAPVTIVEFSDFECPFCTPGQPHAGAGAREVRRQGADRLPPVPAPHAPQGAEGRRGLALRS